MLYIRKEIHFLKNSKIQKFFFRLLVCKVFTNQLLPTTIRRTEHNTKSYICTAFFRIGKRHKN